MSGIEVAGLLLGAFPLCLSALKHYEDLRTVAGTFHRVQRQHREDCQKIRVCQYDFLMIIRRLLDPLLDSEAVTQEEYTKLLEDPEAEQWQEVGDALSTRLGGAHQVFVDTLERMAYTMGQLSERTFVNDSQFQEQLRKQQQRDECSIVQRLEQVRKYRNKGAVRANMVFKAQRLMYAITEQKREKLLKEVETSNRRLANLLDDIDCLERLASEQTNKSRLPLQQKSIMQLCTHAERIFRLLEESWHCECRAYHCADLCLMSRDNGLVDFRIFLRYHQTCTDRTQPWTSKLIQVDQATSPTPARVPSLSPTRSKSTTKKKLPQRLSQSSKRPQAEAPSIFVVSPGSPHVPSACERASSTLSSPEKRDLCHAIASLPAGEKEKVITLSDPQEDLHYDVHTVPAKLNETSHSPLAEILKHRHSAGFTRERCFGLAVILASSHLQLHSTSWLCDQWDAEKIKVPSTPGKPNCGPQTEECYLRAQFAAQRNTEDQSFVSLGIVLLELCFGQPFDDCHLWEQPGLAKLKTHSSIRAAVAGDWLKEVQGHAGSDYFKAVEWTLRQSPLYSAQASDNSWRADFAKNVVDSLSRCHGAFFST